MPHQCTDCGTTFADGSTEMLSGCPDCGGNTFQFLPDGASEDSSAPVDDPGPEPEPDDAPDVEPPRRPSPGDSVANTVGNAAATVKKFVGGEAEAGTSPEAADPLSPWDDGRDVEPTDGSGQADRPSPTGTDHADRPSPAESTPDAAPQGEDDAQASARSAVVSPEELPDAGSADLAVGSASPASTAEPAPEPDAEHDRPDLEELRAELNDQFESIRIVEPGQYELNLMELYEREEYIIALQEDGRYRIQVPEAWRD